MQGSGRRCSFRARQEREKETRVPLIRCDPRSGSPFRPPSPVLNKGTKGCLSGIGLVPYSTTLISNINTRLWAIIHFEKDNCWFKASAGAVQIPFQQRDGLFHLEISPPKEAEPDPPLQSFAVDGRCYAVGNLHLWHRRMRHLSKVKLLNIMKSKAVGGFKVKGNKDASCSCDACSQAKIQRSAIAKKANWRFKG